MNNNNPPVARGNGAAQACASCKYHRRKCTPDCPLAPYFPPDRQRDFLNAHKLFGVRNILKIIRNLDPFQKHHAMQTMIFQANARENDPVGGSHRIILELENKIKQAQAELNFVLHQLSVCRAHVAAAHHAQNHHHHHQIQMQDDVTAINELGGLHINPEPLNVYDPNLLQYTQEHQQQELQRFVDIDQQQLHHHHQEDLNQWIMQQDPNPNLVGMEAPSSSSSSSLHVKQPLMDDNDDGCDDMKQIPGMFDPRQSMAFDPKESIQCSGKIMLTEEREEGNEKVGREEEGTEMINHVQEHDLKEAASLFSLTSL